MFHTPEAFRCRTGRMATASGMPGGVFFVPTGRVEPPLRVIAHNGDADDYDDPALAGWEHVSVSLPHRCPTWEEMDRIKSLFWDAEDAVMQLHPPRSQWVNCHPFVLHLWRPVRREIPLPPAALVGPVTG